MKQYYFISLFLLSLSIVSCKSDKKVKNVRSVNIDVDSKQIYVLNDYCKINKISHLETTDTSIMGNISKLVVKNNKLFFKAGKSVFVFDKKGKFLWKINKRGKGPREYSEITDFLVDEVSGTTEIMDMVLQKVIIYRNNKYVNSFSFGFRATAFQKLSENEYLFYSSDTNNGIDNRFILFSTEKNKIVNKMMPIDPVKGNFLYILDKTNFVIYSKDTTLCLFGFNDTIYSFSKSRIFERYIFINYGNKRVPQNLLNKPYRDLYEFLSKIWKSGFASQIIGLYITKKYIIFGFFQNKIVYHVLYNRLNNKNLVIKKYSLESFLKGYSFEADYSNPLAVDDNENYYFKIEPSDISTYIDSLNNNNIPIEGLITTTGGKISQFDNPIILQLKSK